jgi:hypothetical protein
MPIANSCFIKCMDLYSSVVIYAAKRHTPRPLGKLGCFVRSSVRNLLCSHFVIVMKLHVPSVE